MDRISSFNSRPETSRKVSQRGKEEMEGTQGGNGKMIIKNTQTMKYIILFYNLNSKGCYSVGSEGTQLSNPLAPGNRDVHSKTNMVIELAV